MEGETIGVTVHVLRTEQLVGLEDRVREVVAPQFAHPPARAKRQAQLEVLGSGLLLRALLGVSRDGQLVAGRYGKPELAAVVGADSAERDGRGAGVPPRFNLSHDGGLVACGLCAEPLGVDVSRITYNRPIVKRLYAPLGIDDVGLEDTPEARIAFTREWVLLESRLKAGGTGFGIEVRQHPEVLEGWHTAVRRLGDVLLACACASPFDLDVVEFDAVRELERIERSWA